MNHLGETEWKLGELEHSAANRSAANLTFHLTDLHIRTRKVRKYMECATRVPAMGSRGKVQRRNDLLPFLQEVELNQPTGKQQESNHLRS